MKHKFASAATFLNPTLLMQGEAMLLRKLEQAPADVNALEMLGHIFRKRGDFPSAASVYQRLTMLKPHDDKYAYLTQLLLNAPTHLTSPPAMPCPAPFVIYDDFLTDSDAEEILQYAIHSKNDYQLTPLSGEKDYDPTVRVTLRISPGFLGLKFKQKMEKLLPAIFNRLMIDPFVLRKTELKLLAYANGHFFAAHADHRHWNRLISFSYYFYKQPKAFSGGNLLLYDTDVVKDLKSDHFTSVECIHNRLVLFPSSYYHEVTPLQIGQDYFDNCRFALTGHFQAQHPA